MNSSTQHVLTSAEIEETWPFTSAIPRAFFEMTDVPEDLRALAPYAMFWGASDDGVRETTLMKTPEALQRNLKAVVAAFDDLLDAWLAGSEASIPDPTDAYIAYSAMRMSADLV